MKLGTALFLALGLLGTQAASAETNTTATTGGKRSGHRYLLVVETSKDMDKRSDGIAHTVLDVIGSGLKGQVKRGDSLGVWTFNESLITGKVPLQKYGPENQSAVATSIVEFLKKQKFQKQGQPDKVLPTLGRVITNSELITVVLVSSGNANVQGTVFDSQINATYEQWRTQQQKKKMPFVTLLRGRKGVLTDYAVSPAPFPVELPPVPPEPVAVAKPGPTNGLANAKPATTLAPLYFSGKKSESTATTRSVSNSLTTAQTSVAPGGSAKAPNLNVPGPVATNELAAAANSAATNVAAQALPAAVRDLSPKAFDAGTQTLAQVERADDSAKTETEQAGIPPLSASGEERLGEKRHQEKKEAAATNIMAAAPSPKVGSAPALRPAESRAGGRLLLLTGGLVLTLLGLLTVRAFRHRTRHAAHASLITSSLDRTA